MLKLVFMGWRFAACVFVYLLHIIWFILHTNERMGQSRERERENGIRHIGIYVVKSNLH